MSTPTETAWTYLVVSSEQQVDTLDAQEAWARETATKNGWVITDNFKDVGSGKKGVRTLFADLIAKLHRTPKSQRPARVLMTRIDRLGRGDPLEAMSAVAEIRKLGVVLHTREEGGDVPLRTAMDAMFPMLRTVLAGVENEVRSDRVRAGHARRRAAGKHHGNPPYGARLEDGKVIAHPPEAVLTREIFGLRLKGWGYDRLAQFAASRAVPKLLRDGVRTRRLRWGRSTVQRLLNCDSLRGTVVDEAIWDEVNARPPGVSFSARRQQSWPFPLSGSLRCACGKLLSGHASGRAGNRVRYYVCRNVAEHGYTPNTRASTAEAAFVDLLGRLAATDPALLLPSEDADVEALVALRDAARAEVEEVQRRWDRVWGLLESGSGGIDDEIRKRLAEIKAERERAGPALAEAEAAIARAKRTSVERIALADAYALLPAKWADGDLEARQELAKSLAEVLGGLFVPAIRRAHGRKPRPDPVEISIGAARTMNC